MKRGLIFLTLLQAILLSPALAIEPSPGLTDREIIERLTRLEEGQNSLREGQNSLRAEFHQLRKDIDARFVSIDARFASIDAQFDRIANLMIGILMAFVAMVTTTIGFAIWDRRTMVRPFETKVKTMEEELSQNRQKLHTLLDALRTLSQSDEKVAEVLRKFNLL